MAAQQIVTIPIGAQGVDYVKPAPAHAADWLHQHGYTFACRYIARSSRIGKIVTADEVKTLHANGIAVCLNYEGSAGDVLGGAEAGAANGAFAASFAKGLQYPAGLALFASADTDVYAKNLAAATAYMRAFAAAAAPYRLGVYGDSDILRAVADLDPIGWLPNAMGWSPNLKGAPIHVRQGRTNTTLGIDPNECVAPFEAWLPH